LAAVVLVLGGTAYDFSDRYQVGIEVLVVAAADDTAAAIHAEAMRFDPREMVREFGEGIWVDKNVPRTC
jgi:hypothetical protein